MENGQINRQTGKQTRRDRQTGCLSLLSFALHDPFLPQISSLSSRYYSICSLSLSLCCSMSVSVPPPLSRSRSLSLSLSLSPYHSLSPSLSVSLDLSLPSLTIDCILPLFAQVVCPKIASSITVVFVCVWVLMCVISFFHLGPIFRLY